MRLVLVHGRAQGQKSEQELRDQWLPALDRGLVAAGHDPLDPEVVDVRLPFYGAELDRLTEAPPEEYVTRGAGGAPDEFEAELLLELAARAHVTEAEVAAALPPGVAERGIGNWEWVQTVGKLLGERVPRLGDFALARFVRDVKAYLTRDDVEAAVYDIVRPHLAEDAAVVVGHSLGSIVAYEALTKLGHDARVPLFVTVGSPLGIPVVKKHLDRPLGMPKGVSRWVNGADERDFVSLYPTLGGDTFPADIDNVTDIKNPQNDAHGIAGYLSNAAVAGPIARALKS